MQHRRALVVDDSKVGRITMLRKLEPLGITVDLAESGQEALDYLARHKPDLIFMDHMMPDMDGFEVTRRIKAAPETRGIPVIVVSGNDEPEFIQEARAAGAIDAIAKPPAPGVLEALLESLPRPAAEPAPQPTVVEAAPTTAADQTSVHVLVEKMLGDAIARLRGDLMADMGGRLEAASEQQRLTLAQSDQRWREQLERTGADMDGLRRDMAQTTILGTQLAALDQRLSVLAAETGKPLAALDALEQSFHARLNDHHTQTEQRINGLDSRLDTLSQAVSHHSDDSQAIHTEQAQRLEQLERALPAPSPDADSLLATLEERVATRLTQLRELQDARHAELSNTMRAHLDALAQSQNVLRADLAALAEAAPAIQAMPEPDEQPGREAMDAERDKQLQALQAEISDLRERLDESRLRQLVATTLADQHPPADTKHEAEEPRPQTSAAPDNHRLQTEIEQLKRKVKTLTFMLAIGGVALLTVLGLVVFGG